MSENTTKDLTGLEIAVIGMAGRFPGARNIEEYWENLIHGVESISHFTIEELEESGIDKNDLEHPDYVKVKGVLEDMEYFDAAFFGYTPREAEIMNPQTRVFHECAWEALENAGYDPDTYDGLIGVFAGASVNAYWELLTFLSGKNENFGNFESTLLNNKDFVSTRISYKMNLKGPSFTLYSGCSTSGSALHAACRSLLGGECHMALSGAAAIWPPKKSGYLYKEGMIASPDGRCRVFDAEAKGTVFGDGVGVVILKPLDAALADRDTIYAVIKGSALNNDGSRKVGYSAPSTEGQAAAIRTAYHAAEVDPDTIGYIEAHGTGTIMGDPIEMEALTQAFASDKKGFCLIGSVKSNIGHLDAAAGMAGLIKTVLILKNKCIPPSINFNTPNPRIDFENSPFRVNTALTPWTHDDKNHPRRAGVSIFGFGGTNCHIVLEESPDLPARDQGKPFHLFILSARTETALEQASRNLAGYLERNRDINLADAAYTLQVGRKAFKYKKALVCNSIEEAVPGFSFPGSQGSAVSSFPDSPGKNSVIFMFPGQGSQYMGMGADLYESEPLFRREVDRLFDILASIMGDASLNSDLLSAVKLFLPQRSQGSQRNFVEKGDSQETPTIKPHRVGVQPLLFIFEYALARLMMSYGITPAAMIGHSVGEYTAACLAGVFSLEDALRLLVLRGRLMQEMPGGAMLAVSLPESRLIELLPGGLDLAAVNGPSSVVVSGPYSSIEDFKGRLESMGVRASLLHTSHAFHSSMMEPVLERFEEEVKKIQLSPPAIPFISNITGGWATPVEVMAPRRWSVHLRQTVQFSKGIEMLSNEKSPVFLEVGPGNVLSSLARKNLQGIAGGNGIQILGLMRHPDLEENDYRYLLDKVGRLWMLGEKIDWEAIHFGETRGRVPLPSYPFERKYFWIQGALFEQSRPLSPRKSFCEELIKKEKSVQDWFYMPVWRQTLPPVQNTGNTPGKIRRLVFVGGSKSKIEIENEDGFGLRFVKYLLKLGSDVVTVKAGKNFSREGDSLYTLHPGQKQDYEMLLDDFHDRGWFPDQVFHMWGVDMEGHDPFTLDATGFDQSQDMVFYSLVYLAQALNKYDQSSPVRVLAVSTGLQDITGEEVLSPEKTTVLGAVTCINQEYDHIDCRCADIKTPWPWDTWEEMLFGHLVGETFEETPEMVVAYRGARRWVRGFDRLKWDETGIPVPSIKLRKKGTYLITGGLGRVGFILAKELAAQLGAKLVLTGRSFDSNDSGVVVPTGSKLEKVNELENLGAEVLVFKADAANLMEMKEVVRVSEERFGPINGIIHAAASGSETYSTVNELDKERSMEQFAAKVHGVLNLAVIFRDRQLDFCLFMSSLASVLGGLGMAAYSAANLFMDSYAGSQKQIRGTHWISVNWDMWQSTGGDSGKQLLANVLGELFIAPDEGVKAFHGVLSDRIWSQVPGHTVMVSAGDMDARVRKWTGIKKKLSREKTGNREPGKAGTNLPRNEVEQIITDLIKSYFGYDQVGIDDNFFDLGANSMDLVQLNSKLNTVWNKKIPLVKLLTYTTIRSLTDYVTREVLSGMETGEDNDRSGVLERGRRSIEQKSRILRNEEKNDE